MKMFKDKSVGRKLAFVAGFTASFFVLVVLGATIAKEFDAVRVKQILYADNIYKLDSTCLMYDGVWKSAAMPTDYRDATKLQGRTLSSSSPSDTNVLKWNAGASQWEPGVGGGGAGDVTGPSGGTTSTMLARFADTTGKVLQATQLYSDQVINIASPTNGDTLYYNSGWQKLAKGSDGQYLKLASGVPAWDTPAGGGDVTGPAGATGDNFASFNSTTGKIIKDSGSKASDFAASGHNHSGTYEPVISSGTTGQYWRGDKSWQTLDKTAVGLANVENTTLSTWAGSANITTLGTVTSGTISTGAVLKDVTMTLGSDADGDLYYRSSNKLTRLAKGTTLQYLRMNAGATAPEWATGGSGASAFVDLSDYYGSAIAIGDADKIVSVKYSAPDWILGCSALLHLKGADTSTVITNALGGHTFVCNGNAKIRTDQYKFASSSLRTNGNDDVTAPASAKFDMGTVFTIDGWVRFATVRANNYVFDIGSNYSFLTYLNGSWSVLSPAGTTILEYTATANVNTWYHWRICRNGTAWYLFIDGELVDTGTSSQPFGGTDKILHIGNYGGGGDYGVNGWHDEIRFVKGVCETTESFTKPTVPNDETTIEAGIELSDTKVTDLAPKTAPAFATSITGSYLTASQMVITDGSKNIVSAPVATYPSLTELSYVKGLSSAVQTQINAKAPLASPTFTTDITHGANANTSGSSTSNVMSGWYQGGAFTRTDDDTFSVADSAENVEAFKVGRPVRYADTVGTWSYGIVITQTDAGATLTIDIAGAPMTTSFDAYIQYGDMSKAIQFDLFLPGDYAPSTGDKLATIGKAPAKWRAGRAYMVQFHGSQHTAYGTTQPKVNPKINNAVVSTADSNNGIQLSTADTWVDNATVSINTSNYDINRGEALEINITGAGVGTAGGDLVLELVFVQE